ncbi:Pectinesterase [Macleaya cordata]|uniref:Pectinesterase n=1 Tax=Macleaya cordata TaxID=56857 RepID=A0A200QSJ5_MACCD|nr:Pectinesterase [Macleaya cordata]
MASKLFFSSPFTIPCCVILLVFFFSSPSNAYSTPASSNPMAPDGVCSGTLYPDFCKSLLPQNNGGAPLNIQDYARFSIRQSLSSTRKLMDLIDVLLTPALSFLSGDVVKALEDCRLLSELNMDFLSNTISTIGSTTSTSIPSLEAYDMQTLLSAILTNQQTCYECLQETNSSPGILGNSLYNLLSDGNKMHSVALALYKLGWVHENTTKREPDQMGKKQRLFFSRYGSLPLRMSSQNREKFEPVSGRKVLQPSPDDAVLVRDVVVVKPDGSGDFTAINDAVAAAPNNTNITDGYFLIYICSGVYEEYVTIDKKKKNILMMGDGINQTVITGNRNVVDGWTTFNSASFAVVGQGFVGINITFRNTAGPSKHQAVAVRNGADLSTFYSCSFEGYQDTLYTHSFRQFYRECDIYGTIDFIFGNAAVVFQNCNIYSRLPMQGQFNTLTAQGRTDPNQNTGTSIQFCNILAAPDLAASNAATNTYLGRPWKEYSRTVFMQSFIDSLIHPQGWSLWSGDFAINTLYYVEFNNKGPGSNTSNRVQWPGYHVINAKDAVTFTVSEFILGNDWLPKTGVPYYGGL